MIVQQASVYLAEVLTTIYYNDEKSAVLSKRLFATYFELCI